MWSCGLTARVFDKLSRLLHISIVNMLHAYDCLLVTINTAYVSTCLRIQCLHSMSSALTASD